MPDHDVIIIGAGHNGLTAASLLARAGVDVLCLEKNRYVGGMASTVELFDGFHFEIAGSVVFPIAPYVVADLDLENCGLQPIRREIMATNIGDPGEPALHMYSDPFRMLQHLAEDHGADAAQGFAQLAAYLQGPARALDRFNPCSPPRSLGQIFDAAKSVEERNALRLCFFGSVMDIVDRFLSDPKRHKILHQATFAPYHYERMFGCTGGDFCHGLIHPEQMLDFRPVPGSAGGYRTPIQDLYLCGASCHPGPGVTFLPGYNGAHVVLEDLGIAAR